MLRLPMLLGSVLPEAEAGHDTLTLARALPATRACGTLRPNEGEPELVLARTLTEAGARVSAFAKCTR